MKANELNLWNLVDRRKSTLSLHEGIRGEINLAFTKKNYAIDEVREEHRG